VAEEERAKDPLEELNDLNSYLSLVLSVLFSMREDYPGDETPQSRQLVAALRATGKSCAAVRRLTQLEVTRS
jgi:hypothetical protein